MPRKPASKNVVCLCRLLNILRNFSNLFLHTDIQANSVDPDQTAPRGAVCPGSTLFAKMTFKITKQMTIVVIGSLWVKFELIYLLPADASKNCWMSGKQCRPFLGRTIAAFCGI